MDSSGRVSKLEKSSPAPLKCLKKMQGVTLFSVRGNFSTTEWWPERGGGGGASPEANAMALGQKVKRTFSGKLEKFA